MLYHCVLCSETFFKKHLVSFLFSVSEREVRGSVKYVPSENTEEITHLLEQIPSTSLFSNYLKHLISLQCFKLSKMSQNDNLVRVDLLSEDVFNETQRMGVFYEAIVDSFHNGIGKEFCFQMSLLCSKDFYNVLTVPRDTRRDFIRLYRNKLTTAEENFESGHDVFAESLHSSRNGSSTLIKSNEGNFVPDLVIFDQSLKFPLVVFEVKSKPLPSHVERGVSQLVSYGLAIRDKKKIPYSLKLVLITPKEWYLASLPPYQDQPQYQEELPDKLNIKFLSYGQSGIFENVGNVLCLDRKAYMTVLMNLHQHFESVKSWCY